MTKKTTYNVDLTLEEVGGIGKGSGLLTQTGDKKKSDKGSSPSKSSHSSGSPAGSPMHSLNSTAKSNGHGSEGAAPGSAHDEGSDKSSQKDKEKKNKKKDKDGKKKKGKDSDSSSSSSSSSDSEDERYQWKGMRKALEPWRYPLYSPSASYRQLDVITGSHQYTVSGFSLAHSMGCGTRLCSDFFEVGGQLFRLEIYPAGFTADTRKYVSVFLTTPGSVNPNHVLYEIAILDQSGKDKHIVTSRDASSERDGPLLSYCRGIVAAVPRLAKARQLEDKSKRYLLHDMLVIRATVQVMRGWSSAPALHQHMAGTCPPLAPSMHPCCSSGHGGVMMPGMLGRSVPMVPQQQVAGMGPVMHTMQAPAMVLQPAANLAAGLSQTHGFMGQGSPGTQYSMQAAAYASPPFQQPSVLVHTAPMYTQGRGVAQLGSPVPAAPAGGLLYCYPVQSSSMGVVPA